MTQSNKFLIIMPAYNVEKWVKLNIAMTMHQSYKNFRCIIIDDGSTDNTQEVVNTAIAGDARFSYTRNEKRSGSSLQNYYNAFQSAKPDPNEIVIWLDGDDWFSSVFALAYLDSIYNVTDCWMTYGTYQIYPSGQDGSHQCIELPEWVHQNHDYRNFAHVYSHLRTHRAFLFSKLEKQDLLDSRTGKFYTEATDVAYLFSLAEMCGCKEKIERIPDILLILNRDNPNQAAGNLEKQKATEAHIRNQKTHERIL
jgi:glycosyltransferase involved in cell wall biosynthesis